MITKTVKLHIGAAVPPFVIDCTEGDTMWSWHFQLYLNGARWTIPTGAYATFVGLKKDGNVFDVMASISSNEVVVDATEQMTIVPGDVHCVVKVFDSQGKIVASCPVVLACKNNPQSSGTLSDSAITAYEQAVEMLGQAIGIEYNVDEWLEAHKDEIKGDKGDPGDPLTVVSSSITYQEGASNTTPPTGTWESTPVAVTQGNYLWTKVHFVYSDESELTYYSVARQGRDGSGSVSSVNSVSPDSNGNVQLSPSSIGAASLTNSKVTASEASSAIETKSADFTLTMADAGKLFLVSSSSNVTVTIPTNASVAFPLETEIEIEQHGTGGVSIAGASGVTIDSVDGAVDISGQYGVVALKKIGTDEWLLAGALA